MPAYLIVPTEKYTVLRLPHSTSRHSVRLVPPTQFTRCTPAAAPALKNEPHECASAPPYGGKWRWQIFAVRRDKSRRKRRRWRRRLNRSRARRQGVGMIEGRRSGVRFSAFSLWRYHPDSTCPLQPSEARRILGTLSL